MDPIELLISAIKLIPRPMLPYVAFIGCIVYGMFLSWLKCKSEEQ